jgi:hypothetical protein
MFREWLDACPPQGSVGTARRQTRCPLATYLGPGWKVHKATARYVEPGRFPGKRGPEVRRVVLPAWARRFVAAVDELPGTGRDGTRRVWPPTALVLLDEVEGTLALERRRR